MDRVGSRRRHPGFSMSETFEPEPDTEIKSELSSGTSAPKSSPTARLTPDKPGLLQFSDLPHWLQDNHYILAHYRPVSNSYLGSIFSLFYLHNESVNIYTHLLGSFIFAFVGLAFQHSYFVRYTTVSAADWLVCSCFFLGVTACLGMSATFHCISSHSERVCRFGNALDYLGIVSLISGSFVPMVYYGFYCEKRLRNFYWLLVSPSAHHLTSVSLC